MAERELWIPLYTGEDDEGETEQGLGVTALSCLQSLLAEMKSDGWVISQYAVKPDGLAVEFQYPVDLSLLEDDD